MTNRFKGEVALKVGDKSYVLDLSFNAMCHLEDHFNKGILEIGEMLQGMQADPKTIRAKTIRGVLWGALVEHQPNISELDAGRIVSEAGFATVFKAITDALLAANPEAAEGSGENPPE